MINSASLTKTPNRLIDEKSPYLLQHAYNPVDWYPWRDEAFLKAKREDKPIFLSVGYSACHWCHVMERESFEDEEVAGILNKYFVCVKVDREERPDIDAVYMNAAQIISGGGGWPLSVFMDTDKRPIYAGTYFPKNGGFGGRGPGFTEILETLARLWRNSRQRLFDSGIAVIEEMNKLNTPDIRRANANIDIDYEKIITKGCNQFKKIFDKEYGGFGNAPKFPSPHNLIFLIRYYYCKKDSEALEIAEKTLKSMYNGGIYDHIGFGFCRYSTDRTWLVPHFEKMLYDNALLALAYCEAYQCTKDLFYARAAEEIFEYIIRDMTSDINKGEGGFYNAEDADSEGIEGKFYIFAKEEAIKILGEKDGEKFCARYDITEEGNFEGENILNLIKSSAFDYGEYDGEKSGEFFEGCRKKLFKYREKRVRPFKDDKITASWNGLMICALAYGGRVLNNKKYIDSARNAADFVLEKMTDRDGELFTRYRDGEAKFSGVSDDYAFMIWGLIELYQSTFDKIYLLAAYNLNKILIENFWENGALYLSGRKSEKLISRTREIYDGAVPSANSVSISNFIKLSRFFGEHRLEEMAVEIIRFFSENLGSAPYGHSFALCGLMHLEYLSREIIITGELGDKYFIDYLSEINSVYNPFATIAHAGKDLAADIEFYGGYYNNYNTKNKSEVYICENSVCKPPVSSIGGLRESLGLDYKN
ncbi:MAG: thioredoxin domain-containing protein [Oscillospiraceae bacterium]|nr:thioredoxin domain-containing protein [Oscillospiraceae bacterium]